MIRVFLAPHKDRIPDFEIAKLRRFPVFPELSAPAELDGYHAPVLLRYLDGLIVHRRQLPEDSRTPLAAGAWRLRRVRALRRGGILRGRSLLRRLRSRPHHRKK
jgi:hypothetical protein